MSQRVVQPCGTTSQQTIEVVKIMREELQKREQKEREILEPIWEPFLQNGLRDHLFIVRNLNTER